MLKRYYYYAIWVSTVFMLIAISVSDCNCDDDEDDDGLWSIQNILQYQKTSDFLIAVAYFSIPIELLYFITCSNVPFKWVLVQFIAFIVLCGITHLFNGWTNYGPHSFQLMMALTVFKILTALVSCATAITLLTLIPLLLKFKVRELFLKQNVLELNQEVGFMKKQKEASLHVRMLTQEIRKSLDKHTILHTTLVQLSNTLDLHNCAVWMPCKNKMNLTYELKARISSKRRTLSLPIEDGDVIEIRKTKGVRILRSDSALAKASSADGDGIVTGGGVAAIRMPMLKVSNFKMAGVSTPEFVETSYALLVLILPSENKRGWSKDEMEIVGVVADQVAVALSHASVLEESQFMREQLEERNRLLQQAKEEALMANKARNAFQKVMSRAMRKPMYSISGLLSIFESAAAQRNIVETIVRTSNVLSTLINDAVEISAKDVGRFPLEIRPFRLHPMIKEACCMIKCLCVCKGLGFFVDLQNSLPNQVMGDDRRTFQVLLHMVGHLLDVNDATDGSVIFRVASDSTNARPGIWKQHEEHVSIKFELEITDHTMTMATIISEKHKEDIVSKKGLSFRLCKKLVQMMQGNIWISSSKQGNHKEIMTLVLKFQIQPMIRTMLEFGEQQPRSNSSMFRGLRVLVVDEDDVNRFVTKKLLEKLGCLVSVVRSGSECLIHLGNSVQTSFQVVFLDLHMPDMDGFEVTKEIQRFRSRNCPLIIAITASEEDKLWERCLHAKMNGLLRKPIVLQQFADELCRALQRAKEVV
ncbi:protein EIN4-like [Impatiens glandulifera]|uniref:protein EIN4-like n=1 Tax=Impatiens glandulifera TaxID=253017 RepID=UPI001FB1598F|nr:protein EIN4-like [Impatiens glandulifera]